MLVLRTGYMKRYDGPDEIQNGGAYPEETGAGSEIFNFKSYRGTCYGYGYTPGAVNLAKIRPGRYEEGDHLTGVAVLFIAKKPGIGQVVVGWYRDATVLHKKFMPRPKAVDFSAISERTWFCCMADDTSAILLPENERTFKVPYAPAGHKGFPGHSHAWYPGEHMKEKAVRSFVNKLYAYMDQKSEPENSVPKERKKRAGPSGKPNHERNGQVEQAAVEAVTSHYKKQGYQVKSVESEKLGWDLEVTRNEDVLYVEVKGLSRLVVEFELTPNEYRRMKENSPRYRVCVVCDALSLHKPIIYELKPTGRGRSWRLVSTDNEGIAVSMTEKPGAVCREIE